MMRMERLTGWIRGKVLFSAEGGAYEKLLNRCNEMGLSLAGLHPTPIGVKGWMPARDYRQMHRAARHCHCRIRVVKKKGLPFLLRRYRGRWGLVVGPALFATLCLRLFGLIWCVRYYEVPEKYQQEISRALSENGVLVGSRPTEESLRRARQVILMNSEDLADVSLNFVRGRLVVEVSERTAQPDPQRPAAGSIVAAKDGIIEEIEVRHGFAMVFKGQRVEEGELLVTGTYVDEKTGNIIITPAQGSVIARTETAYEITQPLQFTAQVPTGEVQNQYHLLIGGKRIPLGVYEDPPAGSEVETASEPLELFGFALPAMLEASSVYPTQEIEISLSAEQAEQRARFLLDRALSSGTAGGEILSRSFSGELSEGAFSARLVVERLENIAQEVG